MLQGILSIEERLRRAKEVLWLEKEAHATTKKKLEYMTSSVLGRGEGVGVCEGPVLAPRGKGSREAHDTSVRAAEEKVEK